MITAALAVAVLSGCLWYGRHKPGLWTVVLLPAAAAAALVPLVLRHPPRFDDLLQVPLGALVGAGEFAVCGLLSTVLVSLADREPVGEHNWMAITRGPLLRPYRVVADRLSRSRALGIFALSALCTEFIARGAATGAVAEAGLWPAVAASVLSSCALWTVPAGTLRNARLGLLVGLVTGFLHGVLYWHTGQLLPLVAATFAFLALAVV